MIPPMVSAISTFLIMPMTKKDQPLSRSLVSSALSIFSKSSEICRKRTMGPATSWGKSET